MKIPPANPDKASIDGSMLFSREVKNLNQLNDINNTFKKQCPETYLRIDFPVEKAYWSQTTKAINLINTVNITPIILFDHFYNETSLYDRINYLKRNVSAKIKYFELFNELPHMHYTGEQIKDMDAFISLTNKYSIILRDMFEGSKIISMAPANSFEDIKFDDWDINNKEQLVCMRKYTLTDITGIHLYLHNYIQQVNFKRFINVIDELKDISDNPIWVTETGIEGFDEHVGFYNDWISRFREYYKCEKVIWYRQTIGSIGLKDWGFALQAGSGEESPLWKKISDICKSVSDS